MSPPRTRTLRAALARTGTQRAALAGARIANVTPMAAVARIAAVALATVATLTCALTIAAPTSQAAGTVTPRTSLPIIERQVMCVTCKIALQVAQSPQANLERAYIQGLISHGEDEAEIKRALVAQYGPTVLGLPSTHGFDLAAYLVPLAVVLALIATLIVLLPRWRRDARAQAAAGTATAATLSATDTARLDSDLARFD
jgi:cytochrome c-type biogenesis protein CcmH/NrfF